jgi:hypothetical protein
VPKSTLSRRKEADVAKRALAALSSSHLLNIYAPHPPISRHLSCSPCQSGGTTHAHKRRRALKKRQNCECQLSSVASKRWRKIFTAPGVKILHLHCAADLLLIILYFLILAVRYRFGCNFTPGVNNKWGFNQVFKLRARASEKFSFYDANLSPHVARCAYAK